MGGGEGGWVNFLVPFFHKKVPFLANIEHCPKFLEYALQKGPDSIFGRAVPIPNYICQKSYDCLSRYQEKTKNMVNYYRVLIIQCGCKHQWLFLTKFLRPCS